MLLQAEQLMPSKYRLFPNYLLYSLVFELWGENIRAANMTEYPFAPGKLYFTKTNALNDIITVIKTVILTVSC